MSLSNNLQNLAVRVATECKQLRTLVNGNQGDLTGLTTTQKASLVAAVNELHSTIQFVQTNLTTIDDSQNSLENTWSAEKIALEIQSAKDDLLNGSAAALDTLKELADAINNDANFAATVNASLARRVRVDAAQTFNATEKETARNNIDAVSKADIGDTSANFVSTFNAGLV